MFTHPHLLSAGLIFAVLHTPCQSLAIESLHPGWRSADVGTGIKPSFDFDAQGRIHVMGMTETGGGLVWHARADSMTNSWTQTTAATGYFYGPGDLRVDLQGHAHMAWHNHELEDPDHVSVSPTFGVTRTRIETPGSHNGWDNGLAIGPGGHLYMSSVNPSAFGASLSLEYGTLSSGLWSFTVGAPGSESFMYGLSTSCDVDANSNMHVVFCDTENWVSPGDLRYGSESGGTWTFTTVASGNGVGRFPSMALDTNDRPHIAWIDIHPETNTLAYVRYAAFDGAQWHTHTVDVLRHVSMGFSGARKSVSLALDSNDRVHLAYGDRRVVTYTRRFGGQWHRTTVLTETVDTYNGLVVLRLDAWDRPGIAFWQPVPVSPGTVRFVRPDVSVFFMTGLQRSENGHTALHWESAGRNIDYRIERADRIISNGWTSIGPTGDVGTLYFMDTNSTHGTTRLYRITAQP